MANTLRTDGSFYQEYKQANSDFSADTFQCAEDTVAALLGQATSSDHPGMLLGKVQSGKTRTFISVLALAFDNGYDIALVLSKNSKALIEQTLKRLTSEFRMFVDEGDVEVHDIMKAPRKFGKFEIDAKMVFVAKKQDDNLKRLIDLFLGHPDMATKRVIIIDDEADSASIGYTKKKDIITANKIAAQVSDLRSVVRHTSFLQVTATPYSLYLQPAEVNVDNVMEFKPTRPAFTKLVPVPAEYVGGDTYFGESARSEKDTLESLIHYAVDHDELAMLKKPDGRKLRIDEVLTSPRVEGFRSAIVNFVVGGCIQRINGAAEGQKPRKLRYSFLLHSEAGKVAHDWQEKLTNHIVKKLADAAKSRDAVFKALTDSSYDDLKRSLALASKPVPSKDQVVDAVAMALAEGFVTVTKVNSEENVANLLDDTGQLKLRSPLNIFLGGQVLDRGVTIANLIGFYYGRRPNKFQQDTVLQHSRMYGYRRNDLAVTRFYTSRPIRHAMQQMEEFDSSLRSTIEAGGDKSVQFIRRAQNGSIVPCSPNKILVSTTQTLRPHKRILPIGFQSGFKTGANAIGKKVEQIDARVNELCGGFGADDPVLVDLGVAIDLLRMIKPTLEFPDGDAPSFDWNAAEAALAHLSQQHPDKSRRSKVLLWAARNRNSARLAGARSHAKYIETPDSEKTEGDLARSHAVDYPILFLLRQNGSVAKGWRGTPFYWPVVRAQKNAPTAIYAADTID